MELKVKREWLTKMKRTALRPRSIHGFVENSLPETASNNILQSGVLQGPSFKLRQLVVEKDTVPTIFNLPMESCKPAIGQKNNEKQSHNASRTAVEPIS